MLTAEPIVQELLRRGVAECGMPAPKVVAGRVKSPMAVSEHSGSQNPDLADWPVWRKLIDRSGSNTDRCLPPRRDFLPGAVDGEKERKTVYGSGACCSTLARRP